MAKPSRQVKSTPNIYHDTPTAPTTICVMEDINGNFSLHNDRTSLEKLQSFSALIKDTVSKIWDNFDAFSSENEQTVLAYHANIFNIEPPKGQDLIITAIHTWNAIVDSAKTDMRTAIPTGPSGRKSSILNSTYSLGDVTEGSGDLKTPQAIACLRIFRESITKKNDTDVTIAEASSKPLPKEYVTTITEAELKQIITDRAGELRTKQDPWRIFQYYRPNLITNKLIKRTS